jgi:SHS2 domain-containing protein
MGTTTHEMGVALIAPGDAKLVEAASLLTFALFADLEGVEPEEVREVSVIGNDESELLGAWIRGLIELSEHERVLFCRFRVEDIGPHRMRGEAWGQRIDPARHRLHREPGSVVLNEARMTQHKDESRARLAFDIPNTVR